MFFFTIFQNYASLSCREGNKTDFVTICKHVGTERPPLVGCWIMMIYQSATVSWDSCLIRVAGVCLKGNLSSLSRKCENIGTHSWSWTYGLLAAVLSRLPQRFNFLIELSVFFHSPDMNNLTLF